MAFIHPATGDYNPDLVNQLVMFLASGTLPGARRGALSSVLKDGREESFRV